MDTSFFTESLSDVYLQAPTIGALIAVFLAAILLLVSGFASGSEIAFFNLSPTDLAELDESKTLRDNEIQMLRDDSERTLATILITNNFVNVTIIMLCNYVFATVVHFGERAYWLQFLCITVLLTFLLLLFGEIMPKVYSRQNSLVFCRRTVNGILFLRKLFWPLETILLRSGILAEKVVQKENHVLSVDDLEQALELTDKNDIKAEQKMLQGIIRFGDETAKEVMTSRQDVIDLDIKSNFTDVLRCIVENNYSRIPVYQDNTDNIRGVLYIKDVLPHLSKTANFRWQSLIRPPYFVPETKKIDDLLREFQENKVHIAIVVDEFGGTSGIVTLEDILEEIVGEINDEYDDEEKTYSKLNYNTYIFEGKTLLSDFCKILNINDDEFSEVEGDADTVAGLLLELKGEFPSMHEKLEYRNYTFDVRLGLWKIEETIELFFAANPHLQDLCSRLSDYQSASRRLEILATYSLLLAMTNNSRLSITHYPNGKPHVEGYHVSISHTRGYAVLLISTNKEVAVDIEYYSNRVSRIVHKFIRQDEISSSVDIQLINWSAKETVYKLFSVEALQYFEMRLCPFVPREQGLIKVENLRTRTMIPVHYHLTPSFVLTYAILNC